MMDGTYTGVLDRIVDEATAVLLLESDGEVVEQLDLDVEAVPDEGRHEGAVFEVTLAGGELDRLRYRPDEERERRAAVQNRFDRLSKRLSDAEDSD